VGPFGEFEPPLDLHTRIIERERELRGPRREPWHPPRVLMIAVAAAGVGLLILALAFAAHLRTSAPGPANHLLGDNHTNQVAGLPHCAVGDMTLTIDIRPPSQRQQKDNGWDAAHFRHPVATVVLRNVGPHRCLGGSGVFYFRILDQGGKVIGAWNSGFWFRHPYRPGGYKTFSLPAVWHCDRPGPFTAVAKVGKYSVRRDHLGLSDITCP